jgi:hypothetical protein
MPTEIPTRVTSGPRVSLELDRGPSDRLATLDLSELTHEQIAARIEAEATHLMRVGKAMLVKKIGEATAEEVAECPVRLSLSGSGWLLCIRSEPPGGKAAWTSFLTQVAVILRTHDRLQDERRHRARLTALYETAAQLTAPLDVETVLTTIVSRSRELLLADLAYITLLDQAAEAVRMRVSTGHSHDSFLEIVLPIGAGVGGLVASEREPTCSSDYLNDSRITHHAETDEMVRREGIRSILGVPLKGRGGILGVLYVANRTTHAFTEDEVSLLTSLGDHAALALDAASMYEQAVTSAAASAQAREAAETHLGELKRVEQVHHKLTDVLLAGGGVEGVATSLASALDLAVVITDWRYAPLARVGADDLINDRGKLAPAILADREVNHALEECSRGYCVQVRGRDLLIAPIKAADEQLGYVWACTPATRVTRVVLTSVEQAARVVALEMLRERASTDVERRLRRDFLYELLSVHAVESSVLSKRAHEVWPQFRAPHRPALFSIVGVDRGSRPLDQARELLAGGERCEFTGVYGSHVVVMLRASEVGDAEEQVRQLRTRLSRHGLDSRSALCGVCVTLDEVRTEILGALQLEELLGPRPVLVTDGLGLLTTLFDPSQRERLSAFLRKALKPLEGQPALIDTLEAYYRSSGNRARAARRLNIHVNTLRYRIDKIEALLGGALDEPTKAVPLQVALLTRDGRL